MAEVKLSQESYDELLKDISKKLKKLHRIVTFELLNREKQMRKSTQAGILVGEITQILRYLDASSIDVEKTNIQYEWLKTYSSEYRNYYSEEGE
ncbi:hypothetical protein [Staphylococcus hominis]|uniref:hypothetical protein n=1 Tax=Staphylococcus hominis TaxID=1290 RepID=UPI001642DA7A|nr:hypothetical protein [Staphylococcus hominis]MBC2908747.1 hypothetical protein [Staphylococcus hominis]MBC2911167.1 hypothetical protein [Staphylococcus hominis]MBC2913063.1 hypothetical protein [Staphylococcus hominis]MBC2935801.1 hypothetical protein [Staphylococcus hominis]MBC2949970.1 hypothetical protein [Staphylococcus hominis]